MGGMFAKDGRRGFGALHGLTLVAVLGWAAGAGSGQGARPGIDSSGFVVAPTGRVLVRGAYGLPEGMGAADLRQLGFNVLHVGSDESDWQRARDAGLWVWHSFGDLFYPTPAEQAEERAGALRQAVGRWGARAELLFWESIDEPAWTDGRPAEARFLPAPMIRAYEQLRAAGDRHPVYLNHAPRNTVETLRGYAASCDIVCVDIYPVIPCGLRPMYAITPDGRHGDSPDRTISCVGRYVGKMRRVALPGQAVFVVLQGFAWEALRPASERDARLVRYPSYEESRFMAWDALVHGATGLMYWGLHTVPAEHAFVRDLGRVLREVEAFEPVLLEGRRLESLPEVRFEERGASIWDGPGMLGLATDDASWLVVANPSADPVGAIFSALPPGFAAAERIECWGEARPSISVTDGVFRDELPPYGVRIYRAAGGAPGAS